METKIITIINDVEILATDDDEYVPIRPICQALNIDLSSQKKRIERDILLKNEVKLINATGKDGKNYEMIALPYMYIFGWLFSAQYTRVNQKAQESLIKNKKLCYEAFAHYIKIKIKHG